jgi:hypothetical protein
MSVSRRTVVTGTTSLALAASSQAQSIPLGVAPPRDSLIHLAALDAQTQAALNKSAWVVKRRTLANKYDWLKPFVQDLVTDTLIFNTTSNLVATQPLYDPYQIESLASAVSSLLDRCLTYRQNMYSLEEKATLRALEYELFQNQIDAQRSIELATYVGQRWANEKTGQSAAQSAFSKDAG